MTVKPTYEELERRIQQLEKTESELRKKEYVLRESEREHQKLSGLLRLMCDNVPDMIWAKDLEKKYIFANRAICKNLLNATDIEETIGKTDIFFAERERKRFPENPEWHTFGEICRDTDQITMNAGMPRQFDEYGNVQGKFLFLDVHKAPFIDENEKMIGTVGSARDITEYKRFEKELIFRKYIIESSSCAIATCDLEGKMTYGNTFFQQLWGFDNIGDFLGKPFYEIWLLDGQLESIIDTLLSGKKWSGELKAKKKDGTIFDLQVSSAPVFDDLGNLCALTSTSIDITEQKQAEEALHKERERLASIFEGTNVGTWEWNVQTGETIFNERWAEIIGYFLKEISPVSIDTWMKFTHPDDLKNSGELLQKHFSGELDYYECEARMRHKNGGTRSRGALSN